MPLNRGFNGKVLCAWWIVAIFDYQVIKDMVIIEAAVWCAPIPSLDAMNGSWYFPWQVAEICKWYLSTIYLGQSWMGTLILTSLLVSMGLSTNQQRIYRFAGYLRLALIFKLRQSWQKQSSWDCRLWSERGIIDTLKHTHSKAKVEFRCLVCCIYCI